MKRNYRVYNKRQMNHAFRILRGMLCKAIGKTKTHQILFEGYERNANYMTVYMRPAVVDQPFKVDAHAVAEAFYDEIMDMDWLYK